MKPRYSAQLAEEGQCQRPGCPNIGPLRSQQIGMKRKKRTAYLCNDYFTKLRVDQLNDLFLRFAGGPE